MAGLGLDYQLLVDSPARAFGFQRTPPYMHQEQIELLGQYQDGERLVSKTGVQMSGFRAVTEAGILIWEPRVSKVDTRLADYEFPTSGAPASDWTEGNDSTTGVLALLMNNASVNHTFDIRTQATLTPNATFYMRLARGQAAPGASVTPSTYYTSIVVGDDVPPSANAGNPFRLVLQDGYPPFLQMATVFNGGWYWGQVGENGVQGTRVADCSTLFDETNRVLQIEWLPVPSKNTLIVTLGNGRETLVYRPQNTAPANGDGVTYQQAPNLSVLPGKLRCYGQNGTVAWQYLPMQFIPSAYLIGTEITLPFVYQQNGSVQLTESSLPAGATFSSRIDLTDYTGTRVKYSISLTGGDGVTPVSFTPIINGIQMRIPPVFDYTATVGYLQDVSRKISRITERQWYDREAGIVRTQVGLMLDNANGEFTGTDGTHRAVQYSRWLTMESNGLMQPLSAPVKFLTGWAGMESSVWKADPHREFDIILEDRWYPLSVQDCGALPFLDAWSIRAAIRFLLNMSGVNDADIADQFKVDDFGPNPAGSTDFKLPAGTYSGPRMSFSPQQKFMGALEELASFVHGVLFWNANGVFDGFNYDPGIFSTPYKGTFGVSESGNPANSDFLSTIWNSQEFRVSTKDRRTSVFYAGKDPATNSLQGTFLNADDVVPRFTAERHGFRQPLVVVSNLFSDPEFTAYAAAKALQKVMLPNLFMTNGACFLPNMFALDRYGVYENTRDISGGTSLVCEEIESNFDVMNPQAFGSRITGRWIGNF